MRLHLEVGGRNLGLELGRFHEAATRGQLIQGDIRKGYYLIIISVVPVLGRCRGPAFSAEKETLRASGEEKKGRYRSQGAGPERKHGEDHFEE